jgi:SSS family solute:Na+ symporter
LPNLTPTDWLIFLLCLFCALAIGLSMRSNIKTSKDFFQARRALPQWVCTLAFITAGLGSLEVIAMGAAGAEYGFPDALLFSLGSIPVLIFVGRYMMPLYYGSGARTTPEYLGLRFDQKTRVLSAGLLLAANVAGAGISLFVTARVFQALHIFEPLFFGYGLPREGIFSFCVLLFAAVVLIYVLLAGLGGVMVNQVLQFLLLVMAFLPLVWKGLHAAGGWKGLNFETSAALPHTGAAGNAVIAFALGLVFAAARWTTDFRVLQTAMAAKSLASARRIPIFAAAVRLFLPFLLILPGAIAITLPTPQSTTIVRNENGAIYHEITIVPREIALGRGLVPARLDPTTENPKLDATGHPLLDYSMATPNLLTHFATQGMLGLGLAALLATLMSGLAASVTAFSAVFTCDIYQTSIRKSADDRHYLVMGRWAAFVGTLLSIGAAYAVASLAGADASRIAPNLIAALLLVISLLHAPQLATYLLSMFTVRTTANGAFAGLAAGIAAAFLHYALTLPAETHPGLHGGWIFVLHRYPGFIAQCTVTAIVAFAANLIVALTVSLSTDPAPGSKLIN